MLEKLKKKYCDLSAPVKMSLWFLMCSFLQKGIAMISTPIFTRVMEEYEYGRYSIYTSWSGFFTAIISLNIAGGYFMRGLAINDKDKDRFTSSLVGLTGLLCLGSLFIYMFFSKYINMITGLNNMLSVIMIIEIFIINSYYFWMNKQRTEFSYRPIVFLTILSTILHPILSIIGVYISNECNQVEARVIADLIVNLLLYSWLIYTMLKQGGKFYNKIYWKEAIIFSVPLIPHYLSKIVLSQADRIMIGKYCGMAEAGYYSVAYSLAMLVQIFNQAVSSSLDPWLYKSIKEKKLKNIGSITMKILLIMAILNLSIIAVAPEILKVFAPENFYSAVWVIPPVTASVYFMFMYDLFTVFQYYFAKTKWIMYASLIGAVLNIVLNIIFIPKYGFVAAGFTTLICYILFGIVHYIFMCKVCDKYLDGERPYDFKKIIFLGITLLIFSFVMMLLYNKVFIRYSILCIVVIILFIKKNSIIKIFKAIKK